MRVSPLFARALRVALGSPRETDGLVDPTLGAALEHAGYDRDFDAAARGRAARAGRRPRGCASCGWTETILRRPPGLLLDLNGVVKALAVDEAAATARGATASSRRAATRDARPGRRRAARWRLDPGRPRRARDERRRLAALAARRRRAAPPDRSAHGPSRATRPGSRSRSPAPRASTPTPPPRPRSCSARTGRTGSTGAACRAGSSAAAAPCVETGLWSRATREAAPCT